MHHYRERGLPNIRIVNGYSTTRTPCGDGLSIIDIDGLHRAIARYLVREPGRLTGPEVRFLRRELDLSQEALARYCGVDVQAVARWEKNRARLPGPADRLLRAFYREKAEGNKGIVALLERLRDTGTEVAEARREFHRQRGDWKTAA